ncbi:MAG: acyltransferase [Eubacterium sp.]|nr:acyltransferase [Eubacterium sp.]
MQSERNYKISNCQFLLCVLIVFIHSGCLFMNIPGNTEMQTVFGVNYSSYIQLFIIEGICRIAVPLFMMISGYLFYLSFDGSWKSYGNKLKRRFFSLVIPYLFWSSLTFLAFFFAQKFLGMGEFFTTRNNDSINVLFLLKNIVLDSYDSPLWFCRYLIVFAILSIVLYWPLKKCPIIVFVLLLYLWLFNGKFFSFIPPGLRFDSIFFYFFGAIIALHKDYYKRVEEKINKPTIIVAGVIYFLLLSIRTLFFCYQDPNYLLIGDENIILDISTKILIPLGMFAFWYSYDYIFKNKNELLKLSGYSFLIFAAHHPIVNVIKKVAFRFIDYNYLSSILVYLLSAIITIIIIILVGVIIKRFVPILWKISTGNR